MSQFISWNSPRKTNYSVGDRIIYNSVEYVIGRETQNVDNTVSLLLFELLIGESHDVH